ncbi:hypothetical protein BD809_101463 [Aquimarina intermedia]|uniref:Uncharacterized protein n=1 Tax=Aquimarina intermedia TaxID=350814 RepID=A0A5S5CG35_9FLAO|nr:hypothetical protein BD809_101463 [Aquimarina intermedia]
MTIKVSDIFYIFYEKELDIIEKGLYICRPQRARCLNKGFIKVIP